MTITTLKKRWCEYLHLCKIANGAYKTFCDWVYARKWVMPEMITGYEHCSLCGIQKKYFEPDAIRRFDDTVTCSKNHYVALSHKLTYHIWSSQMEEYRNKWIPRFKENALIELLKLGQNETGTNKNRIYNALLAWEAYETNAIGIGFRVNVDIDTLDEWRRELWKIKKDN